jgi:hypothetical protein
MAFQRGFVTNDSVILIDITVTDQGGGKITNTTAEDDVMVYSGSLVEVDDSFQNKFDAMVRISFAPNVYRVGKVPHTKLTDLRTEYARKRITAIDRQSELDVLPEAAAGWVSRKVRMSWTRNCPGALEVDQVVTVVTAGPKTFTVDTDDGGSVTVAFADFSWSDIAFERSEAEIEERVTQLESRQKLELMTVAAAFKILSGVSCIAPHLGDPAMVDLKIAATSDAFDIECVRYLSGSPQFKDRQQAAISAAVMVNGFTDRGAERSVIWLRPGAQGVGTEVHESLHTASAKGFDRRATNFLSEGITEYLTRKAVGTTFDRSGRYDDESQFVSELISLGATTEADLAALYFTGDWTAFDTRLRTYAGDLVAIDELWTQAESGHSDAALQYLKELAADKEAPLTDDLVRS